MSSATPRDAGLASGLVNTTAQIGGALGLAVTDGCCYHLAFWIACGLVVAAAGAASTLRPRPGVSRSPEPTPEAVLAIQAD